MALKLITKAVGPWPMNTYLVICEESGVCVIVDPGADAPEILKMAGAYRVEAILITHGHADQVGALEEVKVATGAPVYLHPADAAKFDLTYDVPLQDGDLISVGKAHLRAKHTPGHTPGIMCIDLNDGRILVGDTIFVGGPGKTWSAMAISP